MVDIQRKLDLTSTSFFIYKLSFMCNQTTNMDGVIQSAFTCNLQILFLTLKNYSMVSIDILNNYSDRVRLLMHSDFRLTVYVLK